MNYIDIIIVITVFLAFAMGWRFRGIYLIVIPIAFFTGIITANVGYPLMSFFLKSSIINETKRILISYTLVFLIFSSSVVFAGIFAAKFFDFFKITFIDRALGSLIFISIVLIPFYFLLSFLDNAVGFAALNFHESLKNSLFFPSVEKYVFFIIKLPALEHLSVFKTILK